MRYTVLIRKGDDSGYVAECPAIPGCVSQGATLTILKRNIRQAILACLDVMNESARRKGLRTSSKVAHIAV